MGPLLAILAAFSYGVSDFWAGLASRRLAAGPVAVVAQSVGLSTAVVATIILHGGGPTWSIIAWGAVAGVGSGVGTISLYHGLAVGRMSLVAALAGVLTVVVPAVVGVILGDHLSILAGIGIAAAVPAVGLVSWQSVSSTGAGGRAGLFYGAVAGLSFALLFIALDQAGTKAGAWPLIPDQAVSVILVGPFAIRAMQKGFDEAAVSLTAIVFMIAAGLLSGAANLLYLASTGRGELAIVAVLSAMYPAVTVILARLFLGERWTRLQQAGLLLAVVAVLLVARG